MVPDPTIIEQNEPGLGVLQTLQADRYRKVVDGVTVKGDQTQRAENITSPVESEEVALWHSLPLYHQ